MPETMARDGAKAKRINITLLERVLAAIDQAAAHYGDSRSGLLAKAALEYVDRSGSAARGLRRAASLTAKPRLFG
jgi:metal-responsive CopG/Arc/MetJ family transcriptional regulator